MKKSIPFYSFGIMLLFLLASCSNLLDGGADGTPIPGAGLPPERVASVTARNLEFADRIRLIWPPAERADSYKIYRYSSRSEDAQARVFTSASNFYDDTSAQTARLYFYRVAAVGSGLESEKSAGFVAGIHDSVVDAFEPNNSPVHAIELPEGTTVDCLSYCFDGGAVQDLDYFYFPAEDAIYELIVTLPPDSPLENLLSVTVGNSTEEISELSYSRNVSATEGLIFSINFTLADPPFEGLAGYTITINKY